MKVGDVATVPLHHDAIVVGSGVAGLRAAIEAAESGLSVALLAKDTERDSNTEMAQGGVAVALSDEDQVGFHYVDTIAAGDGLCDEAAVSVLVAEGPRYVNQLIGWGAKFDRDGSSRLAFTREAAHSASRVLHAQGDATGREILRALWQKASALDAITFLPHTYSVDIVKDDGPCRGLIVLDEASGRVRRLMSDAVVLATGGLGQIYLETTNPSPATGDGIAIAWRAGALLRDMEFVQFHPTSLHVGNAPRFLLSEALRGEGGLLRSIGGRRFMTGIDPRAELAPRDVVARAIVAEMIASGSDHVLLDMTHRDRSFLEKRFPRIYATCLTYGLDLASQPVPVAPAAHYLMGGVATDLEGRTSVPGLYAAGEVAGTGVHGANRLASNSLLEGLVFGARAGTAVVADRSTDAAPAGPAAAAEGARWCEADRAAEIIGRVRKVAWDRLGILRDENGLMEAVRDLGDLAGSMGPAPGDAARPCRKGLEAGNMVLLASLVARSALDRRESRGAHWRTDFPARDDLRFGSSSYIGLGADRAVFGREAAEKGRRGQGAAR